MPSELAKKLSRLIQESDVISTEHPAQVEDIYFMTKNEPVEQTDEFDQATVRSLENALNEPSVDLYSQPFRQSDGRLPKPDRFNPDSKTVMDRAGTEDQSQHPILSMNIRDFVAESVCSVRLRNVILSARSLPVETIGDYMFTPEASLDAFRRQIVNMGAKSAQELHELINNACQQDVGEFTVRHYDTLAEHARETAKKILDGLSFPIDVLDLGPPIRLRNILVKTYRTASIPFWEFLEHYDQIVHDLRSQKNCGRGTITIFDQLVSEIVVSRLGDLSIDQRLAVTIHRILGHKSVKADSLRSIAELSNIDIPSCRVPKLCLNMDQPCGK